MPRYDGTGPRGAGPMTGRGEGYCILELPASGKPVRGLTGLANTPVPAGVLPAGPARWPLAAARRRPGFMRGRAWLGRRRRRPGRW